MKRLIIAGALAGVLTGTVLGAQAPLSAHHRADIEQAVAKHVGQRLQGRAMVFDSSVRAGDRPEGRARAMADVLRAKMGSRDELLRCAAGRCTLGAEVVVTIDQPKPISEGAEVRVEILERVENDPLRVGVHFAERDLLVVRQGNRWVVSRVLRARVS